MNKFMAVNQNAMIHCVGLSCVLSAKKGEKKRYVHKIGFSSFLKCDDSSEIIKGKQSLLEEKSMLTFLITVIHLICFDPTYT